MFFRKDKKPPGQALSVQKTVLEGEVIEPGTGLSNDVAQRIYTQDLPFTLTSLPALDATRKLHLVPQAEAEGFQSHLVFHAVHLDGIHPPVDFYGVCWIIAKRQTFTFWTIEAPKETAPDGWHDTTRHQYLPPLVEFLNAQLVPEGYRVGEVEIVDRYRGEQATGKQPDRLETDKYIRYATLPFYTKASTRFSREDRRTYVFPKAAWEAALLKIDGYNTTPHRENRRGY